MKIKNISELCYELYKLDWKHSHMITKEIEMDSLKDYFKGTCSFDECSFAEYLEEFGYDGEIYACYEEFRDNEYLDKEYITELLDNDELIEIYYQDINAHNITNTDDPDNNDYEENDEERSIYAINLVYYTEENVPECGATIFVTSYNDVRRMPLHVIKENEFVQEEMKRNGCEGIGVITKISHSEFFSEYDTDLIAL